MFGRRYRSASEVIRSRLVTADGLAVTIRPLFGSRANLAMDRFSSSGLRGSIVISSTPDDGCASAWDRGELADPGGCGGIAKYGSSVQLRRNLFEQFEPFSAPTA
jgi:hypothetical protein